MNKKIFYSLASLVLAGIGTNNLYCPLSLADALGSKGQVTKPTAFANPNEFKPMFSAKIPVPSRPAPPTPSVSAKVQAAPEPSAVKVSVPSVSNLEQKPPKQAWSSQSVPVVTQAPPAQVTFTDVQTFDQQSSAEFNVSSGQEPSNLQDYQSDTIDQRAPGMSRQGSEIYQENFTEKTDGEIGAIDPEKAIAPIGQSFLKMEDALFVKIDLDDQALLLSKDALNKYPKSLDPFVQRNKDFSDGFEQGVYLAKGIMYSSDLQWFFDSNFQAWVPVEYTFPQGLKLLKVKVGSSFYTLPRQFLTDLEWHKKMSSSWTVTNNPIRVGNYDAYTKFVQSAKFEREEKIVKPKPNLKVAAKNVVAFRKPAPKPSTANASTREAQPMVINVSVGGASGLVQGPGQKQQALSVQGVSSLQSFGEVVDPKTGQPKTAANFAQQELPVASNNLYSASSSMLKTSQGGSGIVADSTLNDPVVRALFEISAEVIQGCKLIMADVNQAAQLFYKKQSSLFSKIIPDAILQTPEEKKKTAQYQFAFFNIKNQEVLAQIRTFYAQIIELAKKLQNNSNVLFNGLKFFDNKDLRTQMNLMVSLILELLQNIFALNDLSADANAISIYTMFARFTQRTDSSGGTDEDLFKLFEDISNLFQPFLENHGLVLWMLSFGKLSTLSMLFRYSTNVARMPIMTTLEKVPSYGDGFPGFHGDTVPLYNKIAPQLQSIFLDLKSNYAGSGSTLGLTDIINKIFNVIESRDFLSFMLDSGLDEKLNDLETYKDLKPLVVDSTGDATLSASQQLSAADPSAKAYKKSLVVDANISSTLPVSYQLSGAGGTGSRAYKMPDLVVDVVSGILRELIANKLIYLLGLVNTEVFTLSGVALSAFFGKNSKAGVASRTEKLTSSVVIAAGCLNRSFLTNFTISSISTNKTRTSRNLIFDKDEFSKKIYDNWMQVDTEKNKGKLNDVYGATLLDTQLIESLNDLFERFRITTGVGASAKALFSSSSKGKVDARITALNSQMALMQGILVQEKFSKNFKPMSVSNGVFSMDFWKISQAVDLRILKLILLWYNYISWKTPLFTVQPGSQLDDPSLRGAFQALCKTLLSSTFNEVASRLTYPGVVLSGINFTLAKISVAPVNNCLFEQKFYDISEALTSLSEQCGT